MEEHPSSHQLKLYERRALAPDLFLVVHRHVSDCPSCSEQSNARRALKQDYANLLDALMPEPGDDEYHLTRVELDSYVRRRLDAVDAESVESHLSVCAHCAEAARELRAGAIQTRRTMRQVAAEYFSPLRAFGRPALFAFFILAVLAISLTTLFIKRAGDDQTTLSVTNQAESGNPNSQQSVTAPPGGGSGGTTSQQSASGNEKGQESSSGGSAVADAPEAGGAEPGAGSELESNNSIAAVLSPSSRRAITSALAEQKLEPSPVLARLTSKSGSLRGGAGDGRAFLLLNPVGKVIESAVPTFSWEPLAGSSSYTVTVVDAQLNEVASSGPLTKTEWRPAAPLKRGSVYSWQVTALKDGEAVTSPVMPAPQAKFLILDRASSNELKRVRNVAPRYHLGLGVLYARAGLLDEAEREFRAQLKFDPRSDTAKKLLQSLRSMTK